jgi:hypothetical protein
VEREGPGRAWVVGWRVMVAYGVGGAGLAPTRDPYPQDPPLRWERLVARWKVMVAIEALRFLDPD